MSPRRGLKNGCKRTRNGRTEKERQNHPEPREEDRGDVCVLGGMLGCMARKEGDGGFLGWEWARMAGGLVADRTDPAVVRPLQAAVVERVCMGRCRWQPAWIGYR